MAGNDPSRTNPLLTWILTADRAALTFRSMKATAPGLRRVEGLILTREIGDPVVADPAHTGVLAAADKLMRKVSEGKPGTVFVVNTVGVNLSSSCLAKIFGRVLTAVVRGEVPGRYVVGEDSTGSNDWEADAALRKLSAQAGEKLVLVWNGIQGSAELLGPVDAQVRETYEFVAREWIGRGAATARQLAEEEQGLTIQAASNRFAKAASTGVIHPIGRESVAGGGSQKMFVPIT